MPDANFDPYIEEPSIVDDFDVFVSTRAQSKQIRAKLELDAKLQKGEPVPVDKHVEAPSPQVSPSLPKWELL
jgi:hypothetical protein